MQRFRTTWIDIGNHFRETDHCTQVHFCLDDTPAGRAYLMTKGHNRATRPNLFLNGHPLNNQENLAIEQEAIVHYFDHFETLPQQTLYPYKNTLMILDSPDRIKHFQCVAILWQTDNKESFMATDQPPRSSQLTPKKKWALSSLVSVVLRSIAIRLQR